MYRKKCSKKIIEKAAEMLQDLEWQHHSVVLIPAPDPQHSGHQIRMLESGNPQWYSRFAEEYTNCRGIGSKRMIRPRTYIKRARVVTALLRIVATGYATRVYGERLVIFIRAELDRDVETRRRQKPEPMDPPGTWTNPETGKPTDYCPF